VFDIVLFFVSPAFVSYGIVPCVALLFNRKKKQQGKEQQANIIFIVLFLWFSVHLKTKRTSETFFHWKKLDNRRCYEKSYSSYHKN